MISEEYVSFEVAKLLKEKGFDSGCLSYYKYFESPITLYKGMAKEWSDSFHNHNEDSGYDKCSRPTLQMAFEWVLKKYDLYILLNPFIGSDGKCYYNLMLFKGDNFNEPVYNNVNKEEDLKTAIKGSMKYCLENLV